MYVCVVEWAVQYTARTLRSHFFHHQFLYIVGQPLWLPHFSLRHPTSTVSGVVMVVERSHLSANQTLDFSFYVVFGMPFVWQGQPEFHSGLVNTGPTCTFSPWQLCLSVYSQPAACNVIHSQLSHWIVAFIKRDLHLRLITVKEQGKVSRVRWIFHS